MQRFPSRQVAGSVQIQRWGVHSLNASQLLPFYPHFGSTKESYSPQGCNSSLAVFVSKSTTIFSNQATMLRRLRWPLPRTSRHELQLKRKETTKTAEKQLGFRLHTKPCAALQCVQIAHALLCLGSMKSRTKALEGPEVMPIHMIFSKTCEILTFAFLRWCKGTTPSATSVLKTTLQMKATVNPTAILPIFQCLNLDPNPQALSHQVEQALQQNLADFCSQIPVQI